MKELGRNMRFYFERMLEDLSRSLLMIVVMAAVMVMMEGGDYRESLTKVIPTYLMMFLIIVTIVSSMNILKIYLPLTVSFGNTRKTSLIGMFGTEHISCFILMIFISICHYFLSREFFDNFWMPYILSVIGLFIVMIGFGNLCGLVTLKYGNVKGLVLYIILILLAMAMATIFILSSVYDVINPNEAIGQFLKGPWILLLGLVVDLVIGWISFKTVVKCDLKF